MSFNYNPMSGNPMHHLMLGASIGNLTNMSNGIIPPPPPIITQMPGINDSPLEFNMKKNQPMTMTTNDFMDLENSNDGTITIDRERDNRLKNNEKRGMKCNSRDRERSMDRKIDESCSSPEKNNLNLNLSQSEIMFNGLIGMPQGFMMMPGMMNMMDPSIMGMQQFPLMNQLNPPLPSVIPSIESTTAASMKELISCKSCTLLPPNPSAPLPTTRERPHGCRTVFVGGLPELMTEDIIREVFDRCGEITTLRLSKKNFCHIRFAFGASVDSAIFMSGYRIRIGSNTDGANCGRLHVDYAQARDDQYEWECRQRQLMREQRHRERVEKDRLRPLSPPPIVHYSDHEATSVSEKLKQDESFAKAVQTLVTWLERGDCSKKNANSFYSMIQSTNSHVRRLINEKGNYEEELQKAREYYKKQMQSMMIQFTQIEKVFNAASHKKVWDHFTKAQRKNIDMWKKQSMEIRSVQLEDLHDNDEMEMSDDDNKSFTKSMSKRTKFDNENLKDENDSLRCQLEAYKNEVDLVKSDLKSDTDFKDKQIKVLQETIRNLQTHMMETKTKENSRIVELEEKLKAANVKELLLKTKIITATKNSSSKSSEIDENDIIDLDDDKMLDSIKTEKLDVNEAKLIGLVSTFLVVHPFGANIDYILSYVNHSVPNLRPKVLEEILCRYTNLFIEEISGIGAKIERRWKFCGFDDTQSID